MTVHPIKDKPIWGERTRALVAGLLMAAAIMAACLALVDRPAHASTTFTVDSTGDGADANGTLNGFCDADPDPTVTRCTLRAAIEEANDTPGADVINFNIPGDSLKTITPLNDGLPVITDPVTIDGYTQPGAKANTLTKGTNAALKIELNLDDQNRSGIDIRTDNSVVRGLVINRSRFGGITLFDATGNIIEGNFIGTDASGTLDLSNNGGVAIREGSTNNTVGGTTPAARNLISGNIVGVALSSNSGDVKGNKVLGNLIGTKRDGKGDLGNSGAGVFIRGASNSIGNGTSAGANTIAFNATQGVAIDNTPGNVRRNRVLSNSIFSNGALGIDLFPVFGVNPNDPGDPDTGANMRQNFPVISSAKTSSAKTTVSGELNSTPGKSFKIQFFSNPSGTDEGKKLVGQKRVTTDAGGKVSFAKALPRVATGQTVTATSTGPGGNTSEFSAPRKVVAS